LPTAILFLIAVLPLAAADAVTPGRFTVQRPTLINLGFDWEIAGDDNRNATVEVSYRKAGEREWKRALPLLRIGGEQVYRRELGVDYTVPPAFAGSILDLETGSEYECRFEMRDPDGVLGQAVHIAKARTRSEPRAASGGRVLHVYPPAWKGPKQEPAFMGLKQAYFGSGTGDWAVVGERKVQPGDTILVHAGLYKANWLSYSDPLGMPFDGAYVMTQKGTVDKPIVIRAAGDGEVIFDGNGSHRLFDVMATEHHIFEGLTIRNTDIAFFAGAKDVMGAKALTVRSCRLEDVGIGVVTQSADSTDFYIADNVMIGRDDRYRLLGWYAPGIYGANMLKSYFAVKVYGSGHVVCHNYIAYFHDGACVCTHGMPEKEAGRKAVAIDFYNNDIHLMADDFIEADGGVHNIRVMRNRGVNAAQCGLSAQPVFGGPAYYIRNVLYHVPTGNALKFNVKPAGLVLYHNTIIAESRNSAIYANAHFRNNLFLGTDTRGREVMRFPNATSYSTYDYNGYRRNPNAEQNFLWKAPEGLAPDYELERARFEPYSSLKALSAATGQEAHGIEVDYNIFEDLQPPETGAPHKVYEARDLNFRLRPGGKAVDAGIPLPNVSDHYTGKAPDLGALELDAPAPVYGPRTQPVRQTR
jgi:hypothetical protein